ncbi:alpha-beta hydrolase superfamily lysophospholipase [Tenacibaculum adriaticum]|uniref:Monoacylglycerol lipase n=1 Tax=Tenacibaculum adriaticum TaxID=413713 RepID=A0A5S5DWZ2_9FLAO|nr:alpha/beta hydrolase [Tenacibaculum adriaticum]TYQ00356.1 alpha-beta hydrolase superfamily lysophospholipase [Tenacibaculum adriaticum]
MTHKEFTFNEHKTDFFGQYWLPKNAKAVVVLVHGMGEHSNRYKHVAKNLVENDFGVVAYDNFGHGKTSGKRGHNPSYEAVLDIVSNVIEKAKELHPNKPVFLYGHSMGGNVVINYTLRRNPSIKGVVASSPFLRLAFQPPAWKLSLGKLMQKIAPSITLGNELDANDISRDKEEVTKYLNDPMVHDKVSPNFSLTFIDAGEWAIQNANKLNVPMILLHGTEDKIIDYKGSVNFAENSKLASIKLYENGYHELHNDLCKDQFLQDVTNWLNSQV